MGDDFEDFIKKIEERCERKHRIPLIGLMNSLNEYFPIEFSDIDIIKLDSIYRKEVVGIAPQLCENKKLKDMLKTILQTETPKVESYGCPYISPLNKPFTLENGKIELEKVIDYMEDCAYDAYLTNIVVLKGAKRVEGIIKPTNNYLLISRGDLGEDNVDDFYKSFNVIPKQDFGFLEVKVNN